MCCIARHAMMLLHSCHDADAAIIMLHALRHYFGAATAATIAATFTPLIDYYYTLSFFAPLRHYAAMLIFSLPPYMPLLPLFQMLPLLCYRYATLMLILRCHTPLRHFLHYARQCHAFAITLRLLAFRHAAADMLCHVLIITPCLFYHAISSIFRFHYCRRFLRHCH